MAVFYIFFKEIPIEIICPLFNSLSYFYYILRVTLCILDTEPYQIANTCSHSVGCLFASLMVLFKAQNLHFYEIQFIDFLIYKNMSTSVHFKLPN